MKVGLILLVLFCDSLVFNLPEMKSFPPVVPWMWIICSTLFLALPFMRRP